MFSSILSLVIVSIGAVHQIALSDGAAGVTEADITITGMTSAGTAYVGDRLQCSATCVPPPDYYEFRIRGLPDVTNASSIVLTTEGNFQYICTVYNTVSDTQYSANKTAIVAVFPQQGEETTHHNIATNTQAPIVLIATLIFTLRCF